MEIKATLEKPYGEQQRVDFIIEQNHRNGYEIRETETALEAWGYTEEEKEAQEKERIGNQSAEYVTAVANGDHTANFVDSLEYVHPKSSPL